MSDADERVVYLCDDCGIGMATNTDSSCEVCGGWVWVEYE